MKQNNFCQLTGLLQKVSSIYFILQTKDIQYYNRALTTKQSCTIHTKSRSKRGSKLVNTPQMFDTVALIIKILQLQQHLHNTHLLTLIPAISDHYNQCYLLIFRAFM